jgi:hypothetical protein
MRGKDGDARKDAPMVTAALRHAADLPARTRRDLDHVRGFSGALLMRRARHRRAGGVRQKRAAQFFYGHRRASFRCLFLRLAGKIPIFDFGKRSGEVAALFVLRFITSRSSG